MHYSFVCNHGKASRCRQHLCDSSFIQTKVRAMLACRPSVAHLAHPTCDASHLSFDCRFPVGAVKAIMKSVLKAKLTDAPYSTDSTKDIAEEIRNKLKGRQLAS